VPVLWVMLVLVSFTAIARFVKVWNAASGRDRVIAVASRPGAKAGSTRAGGLARGSPGRRVPGRELPGPRERGRALEGPPQEALSSRSGRTLRERRRAIGVTTRAGAPAAAPAGSLIRGSPRDLSAA